MPTSAGDTTNSTVYQTVGRELLKQLHPQLIPCCGPQTPSLADGKESTAPTDVANLPQYSPAPYAGFSNGSLRSQHITLDSFSQTRAVDALVEKYGRTSHMFIKDKGANFFVGCDGNAALCFRVNAKVAIVLGDPLCTPDLYMSIIDEFALYRRKQGWDIIIQAVGDEFVRQSRERNWPSLCAARELVLNPLTNPVIHCKAGKSGTRMLVQNRWLLHPKKGRMSLRAYMPNNGRNYGLERELTGVYDAWRHKRNTSGVRQLHSATYDIMAFPQLGLFIYTVDESGTVNGVAALRRLASGGYHVDPFVNAPGSHKTTPDLLIFGALSLLNTMGVGYLSLGEEMLTANVESFGFSEKLQTRRRAASRWVLDRLPPRNKALFNHKYKPDPALESKLHSVFPSGEPGLRHSLAMMQFSNINIWSIILAEVCKWIASVFSFLSTTPHAKNIA